MVSKNKRIQRIGTFLWCVENAFIFGDNTSYIAVTEDFFHIASAALVGSGHFVSFEKGEKSPTALSLINVNSVGIGNAFSAIILRLLTAPRVQPRLLVISILSQRL
jgi:hypothetical protein